MKLSNIKLAILVLGTALVMGSCLEDTGNLDIFNKVGNNAIVSFGQADHGEITRTVEVNPAPSPVTLSVNAARASGAITVTFELAPELVAQYNAEHGQDATFENYLLLPPSNYSIPSMSVTIPEGQLDADLLININSSVIDLNEQYILPLRISGADGGATVASNLGVALVKVGVKNIYDGIYEVSSGSIWRYQAAGPSNPDLTLSGPYEANIEIAMNTLSANSNQFNPLWKNGTGIAGIDGTYLIVNQTTNAVTVLCATNTALKNVPGLTNSYDPATRTFTLNFSWGASAAAIRTVEQIKLKWIKPRP